MQVQDWLAFCQSLPGTLLDWPFGPETQVARHGPGGRIYGLCPVGAGFVNLKCEPLRAELLRNAFSGIRPGWHMNKRHWISVDLEGDVPTGLILDLTRDSHALTQPKPRRRDRP